MATIKNIFRKVIPPGFFSLYHYLWSVGGNFYYGRPSRKMVVVGVTGTKGKTTTANFLWSCLDAAGYKTGLIGTANIIIGREKNLNHYHMTMPGRAEIPRLMAEMVKSGCAHCVIETTSQGILQWRHAGIAYDVCVFTNLSEEHLEAHGGSMENYRNVKGKMFAKLAQYSKKTVFNRSIPKTIVVNNDSFYKDYFSGFWAEKKITYGLKPGADFAASHIQSSLTGVQFEVDAKKYRLDIPGAFNVENALPAIALAEVLNIPYVALLKGLRISSVPGRMERVDNGQNFTVFVDYAHEKLSMGSLLEQAQNFKKTGAGKIILLLGAEGGGRDRAKRPIMGKIAAGKADFVVVSNVDPYSDDPQEILNDIAEAAVEAGKESGKNLFIIEDRREGIAKALSLAAKNDIVLITGKGSEQSMVIAGKTIPWDDREVVKEELEKLKT